MLPATYQRVGTENQRNDSFLWRVTNGKPRTFQEVHTSTAQALGLAGEKQANPGVLQEA